MAVKRRAQQLKAISLTLARLHHKRKARVDAVGGPLALFRGHREAQEDFLYVFLCEVLLSGRRREKLVVRVVG